MAKKDSDAARNTARAKKIMQAFADIEPLLEEARRRGWTTAPDCTVGADDIKDLLRISDSQWSKYLAQKGLRKYAEAAAGIVGDRFKWFVVREYLLQLRVTGSRFFHGEHHKTKLPKPLTASESRIVEAVYAKLKQQ